MPGSDGDALFTVDGQHHGDRLTIVLAGEMDSATQPGLYTTLCELLDAVPVLHVVIDLAGLTFCDCAGVRTLLAAYRYATARGASCVIERPRPHITWLLQTTGATTLFAGSPVRPAASASDTMAGRTASSTVRQGVCPTVPSPVRHEPSDLELQKAMRCSITMDARSGRNREQVAVPATNGSAAGRLRRLCAAAAHDLSACGAGVSVLATGAVRAVMVASDPTSERIQDVERIEEIQLLLGEGPCVDALATRRPVLISDFDAAAMNRWPLYARAVHDEGVRAVFAFPLQIGAAQLGVLDIFRAQPGPLSDDELAQALNTAEIAVHTLLDGQDGPTIDAADGIEDAVDHHAAVFQAQGMVMVQLGVTLAEALTRMRAHAFAENQRLSQLAHDVVTRTVCFDPDR